ncbi:hypothetical protein P152DRAFT_461696 [Eremomyces bilateralis CBS 781.70]|uniref:WHIM1 domain-containing protein n=1 Tax=Eremomyces bilateralis CBS 781.70 TaxID=1392243 RepID=A0A6G1FU02_9PEZI|nr:uncharacterized protein P152DRAFT_461696 [Eremomyces bilateralis CBS 781.70]KAF1809277.1 hypothetical protein P152DRAFT_461696 [Eremomyces bilateralis CBS 781.70]
MDDSSSLSSLSSAPPTDDERMELEKIGANMSSGRPKPGSIMKEPSSSPPPKRKRPASPPHEEVLADNPDIAFLVMFRNRFSEAFPAKTAHLGPQDIERGVVDSYPSPQVENLLCALLGLVLNRKKLIERAHYGRALEDAISFHKNEWPRAWGGVNPLSGGKSFNSMAPAERLTLLRTLVLWALHSSEVVSKTVKDSYKQNRHEDDLNQPLSVQPWGRDGDKRQYWLVEGQDDTPFRLYREGNRNLKNITWWNVAGTIDELREVSARLQQDGAQASRRLADKILAAIPRFEATEEKRKRREYRLSRKAQFSRPEPGFSLYEGRTRGKRMKYTFSDDEDDTSDALSVRRSTRTSGVAMPAESSRPTVTASGRQVRSRLGGLYGETLLTGQAAAADSPMNGSYDQSEASETAPPTRSGARPTRSGGRTANGWAKGDAHIEDYNSDEMDDEDDDVSSGNEWDGDDDADDQMDDGDATDGSMSDGDLESDPEREGPRSLIVKLPYKKATPTADADGTVSDMKAEKPRDSLPPAIPQQRSPVKVEAVNGNGVTPVTNGLSASQAVQPQHQVSDIPSKPSMEPQASPAPTPSGISDHPKLSALSPPDHNYTLPTRSPERPQSASIYKSRPAGGIPVPNLTSS